MMIKQCSVFSVQGTGGRGRKFCLILFLFCTLYPVHCTLLTPPAFADAVYLNTGEILKGVVVEEHCDRIVLLTYRGEIDVSKASIDQIFFDNEEQNYTYLGDKAFSEGDFNLAFGFYQRALQINPDYQAAKNSLLRLNDALAREKLGIANSEFLKLLKKQLGIFIARRNDKIEVISVDNDSVASKSGINKGDYINSVWGSSVLYMDIESAARVMVGADSTPVILGIEKSIIFPVNPLPWYKRIFLFLMFNDFGFRLALKPSGLIVSYVDTHGMAKQAGLEAKDEIICINSESVRYMPVSMVRRNIFQSRLRHVVLTVKRNVIAIRK